MKIFNNLKKLKRKGADEKMFFYEASQKWLKQKRIMVKQSTYATYVFLIDSYILPVFKNFTLEELKKYNFNEYVEKLMKTLSPKTIRDTIRILKSILRYIEEEYECNLKLNRISTPKVEIKNLVTLCKREISRIENYCIKVNTLKSLGIVICLNTGMRVGEICALKWKNIDLERGIIYIESTIQRIYDKELGETKVVIDTPKTINSVREIPILGHSSVEITLNRYVHPTYKDKKKYLERL